MTTGTIKLPGVGPVKKPFVIAGVGVLGGILVYAYWKRSKAPAAAPGPAASDTTNSTSDTGYAQDSTASGYNTVYPGGYYPYTPPTATTNPYTTNAEWADAAESALSNAGISLSVSTLAISRVLGGLSVTSAQRDIFLQAKGLLGVAPPNGYPTPIKLTDSGTGNGTPPGGALKAPTGLKVTKTDKYHVWLTWSTVTGADYYRVYRSDAATNIGSTEGGSIEVSGLRPNTTYHFSVRAVDNNGHLGAVSGSVVGRTKK